ncbi:MAG: CinA family protein [Alphaproteobacteria bacterium]|nr:CinA family protein [Alphaproteobacteria bacterium]
MSLFPQDIHDQAKQLVADASEKRLGVTTAESCTGGLIAACITDIPGSSDMFDRGFVTYSNDAKMAQISVDRKTLADFGAVSAETAIEMAEGALRNSHADIAVAVTGIAGPTGNTDEKPVGLVYIALVSSKDRNNPVISKHQFDGDRHAIRLSTVKEALQALEREIEKS